jgi:hypothetical protein
MRSFRSLASASEPDVALPNPALQSDERVGRFAPYRVRR